MLDYLENIMPEKTGIIKEMHEEAIRRNIPIIRDDVSSLLQVLIKIHKPKKILEAGTAIGYSAIVMAYASVINDFKIETIEIEPDLVAEARENIKRAGLSDKIRVIAGDMTEVFSLLESQYDMIFVDGAKGHYITMYEDILRLLKTGGLLVCDNVIFYGKILDEPENAPHKHRTIVRNMRAFLEKVTTDKRLSSSVLETGDGLVIAYKEK